MSKNIEMALENLGPLDPELQWIASESVAILARSVNGELATVRRMVKSFCPAIAKAVSERLGAKYKSEVLTEAEATTIGVDALTRLDPHQSLDIYGRIDLAARVVAAAAKLRFISPAPVETSPEHAALMGYWPFGQDGGFCNPNKLA